MRCHYFIYAQRPEDEVLETLTRKVDVIQRELGSLGCVLMDELSATLEKGIRPDTLETLRKVDRDSRAEATRKELESQRLAQEKLKAELKLVEGLRERSRKVMDFDSALLRDALDVGFGMSGAGRLTPGEAGAWTMPELPAGWARTLDGLRPPKQRDEAYWEWRQHPLLPVTFDPPKGVAERLNHLHLSHPVVQRVMQRFLSQGFSGNDLSRVTVVRSSRDAVARVIVFGRLSLFGAGAARLHNQLVSVSAKWIEGGGKGHLKPFAEEADRKAIEQLETTLAEAPELSALPEKVKDRLLGSAAGDFATLWPEVEAEAKRRAEEAKQQLKQRGATEAAQLRSILETQREAIEEALGDKQLDLSDQLTREEREQWRRDKSHLQTRLQLLEKELLEQPSALAALYEVRLPRVTPVGMVYLWPGAK